MIRLGNLSWPVSEDFTKLQSKTAKLLQVSPEEIAQVTLAKQSVDARKKNQIHYKISVDVSFHNPKKEEALLKKSSKLQLSLVDETPYAFPEIKHRPSAPVVVGMGPAGLFAAYTLAKAGIPPILLERGQDVDSRSAAVEAFWSGEAFSPSSNVQFGEGGAGTFSDGKLTTGTKDPRQKELFRILVEAGADPDILYSHKPHIGTDVLRSVLKYLRESLISMGCDLRFQHQMVGISQSGGQITGLEVQSPTETYHLSASHVVCAIGHSARDSFQMLYDAKVPMEAKPFAIGARIEHLQNSISLAQYGPDYHKLPPTDYKLACHLPSGRSLFSFCVCPGGVVVNASSEEGHLVTNGMSYRARDKANINGGLLVGLTPADFPSDHPLAGMHFQSEWEQKAFQVGGGNWRAPCQRVEDFLLSRPSNGCGAVSPSYSTGVSYGDLSPCLPDYVSQTMREGLPILGKKVEGFDHGDALLTAIETRSSSPVKFPRDHSFQSTLRGFYPCGEGTGHAGGIVSAAVDGMKVAEAMVTYPR